MTTQLQHINILRLVARGVTVSQVGIRWYSDPIVRFGPKFAEQSEEVRRHQMIGALQSVLYTYFYTVSRPTLKGHVEALRTAAGSGDIASALDQANPGEGRAESGWLYVRSGRASGTIVLQKDGLSITAPMTRVLSRVSSDLMPDTEMRIRTTHGSLNASPGFYVARSDVDFDYSAPITRVYINISPSVAPSVLHQLCKRLNHARHPFDFKVVSDISQSYRADTAVLYIPRSFWDDVFPIIRGAIAQYQIALRPTVPAMVFQLAPGVGVADDPSNGESFGTDRCRMIAEALVSSRDSRHTDTRIAAIASTFEQEGVHLDRPYLRAGFKDIYAAAC